MSDEPRTSCASNSIYALLIALCLLFVENKKAIVVDASTGWDQKRATKLCRNCTISMLMSFAILGKSNEFTLNLVSRTLPEDENILVDVFSTRLLYSRILVAPY